MIGDKILGRLGWLWGIVFAIGILELVFQWRLPDQGPAPGEWKEAARSIAAEKQERDLVVIAPEWAIEGRMYLGSLISVEDLGRFDTSAIDRIFEVSVGKARASQTRGLAPESETRFGDITVRRYKLGTRVDVLYDFTDPANRPIQKGAGRANPTVLIDHRFRPRRALAVPLKNKKASLTFEDVPLEGVLRGYGLIDYRNARFDEGGPVEISIHVNEEKIGQEAVRNFSPLRAFEFPLEQGGRGTVRFEIQAQDGLTRVFGLAADVRRRALINP